MGADVMRGQSYPLGATVYPNGVNFSVFSKNAEALELLLFDHADSRRPSRVIRLDPKLNKTFYYWHTFLSGVQPGQLYAYRAYGPFEPERGHRFDGHKVLLDPYAKAVAMGRKYSREAASRPGDNVEQCLKAVVVDSYSYNWENDLPLHLPYSESVIYELHVGGFTKHPSSGLPENQRGTYAGLIEKIPYLHDLGITAVELLPIQQFDEQSAPKSLKNYWGYSPVVFFAPHSGYSSQTKPEETVTEFRDMVKAFHRAGIEVILDVVFNHTAESDHEGPTLCFRGLENRAYYILDSDQSRYADYSGCGNAINANQSIVRRMIIDCLRYWVAEMHIDGFRFDLASVMARDEWGQPLKSPPILWEIESDPILASTKIIAEAWDAVGLYQVGTFIGHRWAEWNGQFRDDARSFVKSDTNTVEKLTHRIVASPDLYPQPGREPNRSINFVTCHDGFTLNDLVSYNQHHNGINGQDNRDGSAFDLSWNCGVEGPSDDPEVEALRLKQIKNMLTILFVSQGTPMILMGDEARRTQQGNNNAYCQDNEISWFDWTLLDRHAGLQRFVKGLITFTQGLEIFREERFWTTAEKHGESHITFHGVELDRPDLSKDSHSIAFMLDNGTDRLYVMLNAYWGPLQFELPPLPFELRWFRVVDTSLPSPDDFCDSSKMPSIYGIRYAAAARSSVVLWARPAPGH